MDKVADLVIGLQKKGVKLWEEDGLLKLSAPKGVLLPETRIEIGNAKDQILKIIKTAHLDSFNAGNTISVSERSNTHVPLSFSQKRLWYLSQLEKENSVTYNMPAALLLKGTLNEKLLLDSLNLIIKRHEVLRTSFRRAGEQVYQDILPQYTLDQQTVNREHLPGADQEKELNKMVAEEATLPFNLSSGPLIRIRLIRLGDQSHVFLVTLHHIISDGWSIGIFIREMALIYSAFVQGVAPDSLPDLPIQFADFAIWQRNWLSGAVLDNLLKYWKSKLEGIPALISLPTDNPRPEVQSFRGALEKYAFDKEISQRLKLLCKEENVTPFMALISVYAILLSRWSGQEDIVIGSVIANRNRKETEHLIGFFVNSLVFRIILSQDITFSELLQQVRTISLDAFDHQDLPFEKLVEELRPERALSHSPLFQVAFAWQNAGNEILSLPGLEVSDLNTHSGTSKYDITLFAGESDDRVTGVIEYNSDIFEPATIRRFINHFQGLLAGLVQFPGGRISDVDIFADAEKKIILNQFCGISVAKKSPGTVLTLFEENVRCRPLAVAVRCGEEAISYNELDAKANRLADFLIKKRLPRGEKIGVMAGRSIAQVVGLLAVLKAGGCYVPVDPDYPGERLQFIVGDAGINFMLVHSGFIEKCPANAGEVIAIDIPQPIIDECSPLGPGVETMPNDPAYMIYTSGSTGRPKGVVLGHGGLLNMVEEQIRIFHVTAESKVLQFASPGFDASISEYFMALGCGASLVLVSKDRLVPDSGFSKLLIEQEISHITLTPGFLALLPYEDMPQLTSLIVAGETCSMQVVQTWAGGRRFYNAYGPTEATVCTSISVCNKDTNRITIGRPLNNIRVYILNSKGNICPVGIPGELYIGGAGVALGYHERPDLNAEKFVTLNIGGTEMRLYRSGDRARFLTDGEIEFLGRIDEQVKIRGFRIEPGEIEAALRSYKLVRDAAVVINKDKAGEKRLFAFVCPVAEWERNLNDNSGDAIVREQVEHWREIFDNSYNHTALEFADATFNILGWNSSYTGLPIPVDEMRHWVSDTVERILEYRPKNVLEIGCGSGLLLFRISPHCEHYLGTDFSANAIEYLRPVVRAKEIHNVELLQSDALDITNVQGQFDMVILNSVAQYFPDQDYLLKVINIVTKLLAPGGHFFLGDVRIKSLNDVFQSSVELFKGAEEVDPKQLLHRISLRVDQEEELLVDPQFFRNLPGQIPGVTGIKTLLKKGRYDNELNTFRYDVVIEKEGVLKPAIKHKISWDAEKPGLGEIQAIFSCIPETPVILRGVRNSRVVKSIGALDKLRSPAVQSGMVRLSDLQASADEYALHPEDFFEMERVLPYKVEISWPESGFSAFDVCFYPAGDGIPQFYASDESKRNTQPLTAFTNEPLKGKFLQKFVPVLKSFLAKHLPDYMIPAFFEVVDSLPLTPHGKTDRALLTKNSEKVLARGTAAYVAPRNHQELHLLNIWEALLNISPIGVYDNFFDAGGHSLLAVQLINKINAAYACEMTLVDLFSNPDIAAQASFLDQKKGDHEDKIMLRLSDGGSYPPLFFVPGAGGNVLQLAELGRSFNNRKSFYGLQAGKIPQDAGTSGVEFLAQQFVTEIKKVQNVGPYFLGAHSFGGWIAYEMACQLESAGEKVAFLGILDGIAPSHGGEVIGEEWDDATWLFQFAVLNGISPELLSASPFSQTGDERLYHLKNILESQGILKKSKNLEQVRDLIHLLKVTIGTKYEPGEMTAKIPMHLFLASAENTSNDNVGKESELGLSGGWGSLASKVNVIRVSGDHFSMLKAPNVKILASAILNVIE